MAKIKAIPKMNAKATPMSKKGKLSASSAAKIRDKANRMLQGC